MAAKASLFPSPYPGPALVTPVREAVASNEEAGSLSGSGLENTGRAKGLLEAIDFEVTAIDFEVASAQCLYGVWQSHRQGDVYLIRTLDRISEHMKALHAIQAKLSEPEHCMLPADSRSPSQPQREQAPL
jgi:hypothetical protein